ESLLKNHEIKKTTSLYPELKNKRINYKTAIKLQDVHKRYNLSKISDIPTVIEKNKAEINNISKNISTYEQRVKTANQAEIRLGILSKIKNKLEAIENNPFQYGKLLHDSVTKEKYKKLKKQQSSIGRELRSVGYTTVGSIKEDSKLMNELKPTYDKYVKKLEELQKENETLSNVQKDLQRANKREQYLSRDNGLER
ncbi:MULTISPECIES: hypothetical protein, partial [unclassified Niallia]